MRIPLTCSPFLRSCCFINFSCFSLPFPFFDFDWDIVFVSFCLFSCGYYAVSSVSVSAATRLAYVWSVSWYVRTLISPFHFVWSIRFVSVIVCILLFCMFSSWGNLPLQSYWSLSCDHGLHCCNNELLNTTGHGLSPNKRLFSWVRVNSLKLIYDRTQDTACLTRASFRALSDLRLTFIL